MTMNTGRFDKQAPVQHGQATFAMRSRQNTFSPLLRSLAAAVLLAWVTAFSLCSADCAGISFGAEHGDSAQPSSHGAANVSHHDGDSSGEGDEHCPSGSLSCSVLKSALLDGKAAAAVQPQLHVLYMLAPVALALDATHDETAPSFRQGSPPDWLSTLEVFLGPAFRSLAPPVLL